MSMKPEPKREIPWPKPSVQGILSFLCAWVPAFLVVGYVCRQIGSLHSYGEHTLSQVAMAITFSGVIAVWMVVEVVVAACRPAKEKQAEKATNGHATTNGNSHNDAVTIEMSPNVTKIGVSHEDVSISAPNSEQEEKGLIHQDTGHAVESHTFIFLEACRAPLRAMSEFILIMGTMYICDRTDLIPIADKVYDPKQFWGLWLLICLVALFTVRTLNDAKPLQREQTDEWKGWMQLMFLMYHYFEEKEVYNAIRMYIAAYVWMTGYGNYSLYARGKSFTTRRTFQMLFRLNFLVFFVCVILNNEYMLYYIAPMHTLFTVFVILMLYLAQQMNESRRGVYAKIVFTFVVTALLYDGPDVVFRGVFGTLPVVRPLLAFHDPLHPEFKDEMHEWHFRSGLDRFIWIIGMVSALHFKDFGTFLTYVESKSAPLICLWRIAICSVIGVIIFAWWWNVFSLHKYKYNEMHPFTSFIPITSWLVLRNLVPFLRQKYLYFFAYLGRVTLETYILQFHVWMKTTGINGSPKKLLAPIQASYWVNFALMSAIYLFLSIRCFHLTVYLRDVFVPESNRAIGFNCVGIAVVAAISLALAAGIREMGM